MLSFCRFAQILLFCALAAGSVRAAELGDAVVRSYIGQPLVAEVELTLLEDPASVVTVRMAHADVYKGANISMNPVLSSLTMSVMKRDGRQYLHLTSTRPVATENVNLFLELTNGGKRNVRTVTLWLTPDPAPAPSPAPPPPPAPVAASRPVVPATVPEAKKPVPATLPAPVVPPVAAARPVRVLTLPAAPAAGPTCPQSPFSAEQIRQCAVMDEKNAALSAQIVELEAKVRGLQLAIEGKLGAPAAAVKAAAPPPPPPPPPPRKKVVKQEAGFPWMLVVGGLLLLAVVAGAVWYFLKRRRATPAAAPSAADPAPAAAEAKQPWHRRMLVKLKRKPKAKALAAATPPPAAAP